MMGLMRCLRYKFNARLTSVDILVRTGKVMCGSGVPEAILRR